MYTYQHCSCFVCCKCRHAILGIAAVAESAEAAARLAPKTRFNYARLGHHASPTARKILRHPTVRKEDHHHHHTTSTAASICLSCRESIDITISLSSICLQSLRLLSPWMECSSVMRPLRIESELPPSFLIRVCQNS